MKPKRWAQERNFNKFRLMGTLAQLQNLSNNSTLTVLERARCDNAIKAIKPILGEWEQWNYLSKICNTKE